MGADGWDAEVVDQPVPSEGDTVHGADGMAYRVRHVVFYPWGDGEGADEPFVYVVLGQP